MTWRSMTPLGRSKPGPAHEVRSGNKGWCGVTTEVRGNRFGDVWKTETDPPKWRRCVKCRAVKNKEAR